MLFGFWPLGGYLVSDAVVNLWGDTKMVIYHVGVTGRVFFNIMKD